MGKKLSIVKEGNTEQDSLNIENNSLTVNGIFVGEGSEFRPIHCTELREKLRSRGWNNETFKFYFEKVKVDPITRSSIVERTYKYKLKLAENYTISDNYIDDGLPIINPSTEELESPDIIVTRTEVENIGNSVNSVFSSIFGEQRGDRELKINRSSKNKIDIIEDVITLSIIDSENTSAYSNTLDLNDLINHANVPGISGKADINYLYSINGEIFSGDITLRAFDCNKDGEITKNNLIFQKEHVVIEYINGIIRIFPLQESVNECILNDVVVTYGNLEK